MKLTKLQENIWQLEKEGTMLVPAQLFASPALLNHIQEDGRTLDQLKNVAHLPGIIEKCCAMPDAHQGYGFPIGGVAAFDLATGIISPGGVGYDINCGVRLLRTGILAKDFLKVREKILAELFTAIPAGVGKATEFKLTPTELNEVLNTGVAWAVTKGYATVEDSKYIEDNGCIGGADSAMVSKKAKARGKDQLGSLGSGNHFLELQVVETIYNKTNAQKMKLEKDELVIMIHSGSRGLGHQTASDYIQKMEKKYGFKHLPDRELACAPINSPLGKEYRAAMNAAANFAFVNRQLMTYQIRNVLARYFPKNEITIVYDIAHNIAKFEEHMIDGKKQEVCVHRKGATRSFGPGRKEIPSAYRSLGCPIFLPGSMGTYSYVLLGTKEAEHLSFGSTAHGAGRVLSRSVAIATITPETITAQLKKHNILLKASSQKGMVEEAPQAYKDINEVARVSDVLKLGTLVARLKPLAVLKG